MVQHKPETDAVFRCPHCDKPVSAGQLVCFHCKKPLAVGNRIMGLFSEEAKSAVSELLDRAVSADMTEQEFADSIFIGGCPACGSSKTENCESVAGVEDITVGHCLECETLWCSECGALFGPEQTSCGHWELCERCAEEACEVVVDECDHIIAWKNRQND